MSEETLLTRGIKVQKRIEEQITIIEPLITEIQTKLKELKKHHNQVSFVIKELRKDMIST